VGGAAKELTDFFDKVILLVNSDGVLEHFQAKRRRFASRKCDKKIEALSDSAESESALEESD